MRIGDLDSASEVLQYNIFARGEISKSVDRMNVSSFAARRAPNIHIP
jgi:hypothetical protein